jgi:predicted ATP-grasp superfamily ATP-dependent carboligase
LAQSACRAGYAVHVLDLFRDLDTRDAAVSTERIGALDSGIDRNAMLAGARRICAREPLVGIVTGSGFEDRPECLDALAQLGPLFANSAEAVRAVKDPDQFFPALTRLGIPCPETTQAACPATGSWLSKHIGAAGGAHIRNAQAGADCAPGTYFQKKVTGDPHSVLFLANGQAARVIGYSRQWPAHAAGSFVYGGSVSLQQVHPRLNEPIAAAVDKLAVVFALRGLCGLDFIVTPTGDWRALEINPRPPATFELHEWQTGLAHAHIEACLGRLPESMPAPALLTRAHAVHYAPCAGVVTRDRWPDWTSDRPEWGTRLHAGQPVCTVHAQGHDHAAARNLVEARLAQLAARGGWQWTQGQLTTKW